MGTTSGGGVLASRAYTYNGATSGTDSGLRDTGARWMKLSRVLLISLPTLVIILGLCYLGVLRNRDASLRGRTIATMNMALGIVMAAVALLGIVALAKWARTTGKKDTKAVSTGLSRYSWLRALGLGGQLQPQRRQLLGLLGGDRPGVVAFGCRDGEVTSQRLNRGLRRR